MSLQVNEVLYNKKSKFQDVMVFKRWVTLLLATDLANIASY